MELEVAVPLHCICYILLLWVIDRWYYMGLNITIPPWTSHALAPRRSRTLATCCAPVRRFAQGCVEEHMADYSKHVVFLTMLYTRSWIPESLDIFYITWYMVPGTMSYINDMNHMNRMYSSAGCTGGSVRCCSLFKLHFDVFPLACPLMLAFYGK